jgi:site-specific DNA-methyltransferase (adenine-specific)
MESIVTPYYEDGDVRLFHGDCREITAWLEADVLVTDPPYGVAYETGKQRRNGVGIVTPAGPRQRITGDHDCAARDEVLRLWSDRPALVFGSWRKPRPANTRHRLIWHKRNTTPALGGGVWCGADEEVYVLGDGWVGPRRTNVYVTDEARAGSGGLAAVVGHPTPKPVGLMEQLLESCPAGAVADPFAGSGSTLLAARAQGRRAIGVEIDESYCEVIARRLDQGVLFEGLGA